MVLYRKQQLRFLFISMILINVFNSILGQSIELEKMKGVPEYQLRCPHFNGQYYFVSSSIDTFSYLTETGLNYQNVGCSGNRNCFFYSMENGNVFVKNFDNEICLTDKSGTELILLDTFSQSYFVNIPIYRNYVFYPTHNSIYRINQEGAIEVIKEFGNTINQIYDAKVLNDKLYILDELDGTFRISQLDDVWNLISSIELNFKPSQFIINEDLWMVSIFEDEELYYSLDGGMNWVEFQDPSLELGSIQRFGILDNKIIMHNRIQSNKLFNFRTSNGELEFGVQEIGSYLSSNYYNDYLTLYGRSTIYRPISLSPLKFDTIDPLFTSTRIKDVEFHQDTIHALTENGYYRLDMDEEEWYSIKGREIGSVLMELDGEGNIYIPSNEGYNYSSDGGETFSTKVVGTGGDLLSFSDTLLFTGSGQCGKLLGGFPAKISTDGGETWTNADFDPAPCYVKDKQTITEERIWVYDEDVFVSFGPGMGESYWLGYFDRKEERFRMIEPIDSEDYKFYVDREETIYAHPKWMDDIPAYWSNDLGETWKTIPDVPKGLIYPTADSTGTIILHYTEEGLTTYVQWGEDENYTEVPVTPSIDGLIHDLFYTSDGRMVLSMEDGNFYIAEGLVNSTDELNSISPDISIYPNPTRQSFSITGVDVDTVTGLEIYDLQGRLLSSSIEPVEAFDVSHLSEGVYVLKMKLKDGREIGEKVVVLR